MHGEATTAVVIEHIADAPKGQPVTRLQFGGWVVTIDAAGAVRVPHQSLEGKTIEDLDFCLQSGYALLQDRELPVVEPRLKPLPALPDVAAKRTSAVLCSALISAQRQRHWRFHDFYACLSQAWLADELKSADPNRLTVSYRLLVRALRAALPYPTTLTEYGRTRSPDAVFELYRSAITLVGGTAPAVDLHSRRGVA